MRNNRLVWTLVLLLGIVAMTASAYEQAQPAALYPRATTTTDNTKTAATTTAKDTATDSTTTATGKKGTASGSASDSTDTATGSAGTGTGTRTTTRSTKVGLNVPAGGVQIKTPSAFDPMSFYPIDGDPITWVYNYTSLIVTPTAVNVQAWCSQTQEFYTIADNYSVAATSVVWDVKALASTANPALAMATYTLYLWDSSTDKTSLPSPGHLGVFNSLQFGLYTPKTYVDKDQYVCQTCNSAVSLLKNHGVRVLLGTALITALSFSWFLHGIW